MSIQKQPILFIIFNRPYTTKLVFEKIRKLKPSRLYIAADGPRASVVEDAKKCKLAREITENIDWTCKVNRLYRKTNLGCGKAVSGAIDWFFENEEKGIILEDDCLIDLSFYDFVGNMLEKYKNDHRIMNISGDNFMTANMQDINKYYLSKYVHIWGWGTWKRAWKEYDFNMKSWKNKSLLWKYKSIDGNFWDKLYWISKFDSVGYKITDTWDYQWIYAITKNNGLSVVPGANLVSNIGFGNNSTHTTDQSNFLSNLKTYKINKDIKVSDNESLQRLDGYERDIIFKIGSISTIIHFGYFSIFNLLYNVLSRKHL